MEHATDLSLRRLEVVDDDSDARLIVGELAPDVFGFAICDKDGHERASLSLAPEGPSLAFSMGGNTVLQIGVYDPAPTAVDEGPYVVLTARDGATAWECHVSPDGTVSVEQPDNLGH